MSRKPARPDAEIEQLAAELRARWTPADGIMPWLRKRLSRLTRLHEDEGWSWADIGRAMDAAGIRYETGRAWTGFLLARKVGQARAELRKREAKRAAVKPALPRPVELSTQAPAQRAAAWVAAPAIENDSEPQPTFALASLPGRSTPPEPAGPASDPEFRLASLPAVMASPSAAPEPARPVPVRQRRDPDAEIAKLLARPKLGSIPMPTIPEPEDD